MSGLPDCFLDLESSFAEQVSVARNASNSFLFSGFNHWHITAFDGTLSNLNCSLHHSPKSVQDMAGFSIKCCTVSAFCCSVIRTLLSKAFLAPAWEAAPLGLGIGFFTTCSITAAWDSAASVTLCPFSVTGNKAQRSKSQWTWRLKNLLNRDLLNQVNQHFTETLSPSPAKNLLNRLIY